MRSLNKTLKRSRVEIELETVSKYFKKEVTTVPPPQNEDKVDQDVDIKHIKSMNSQEYFDYIEVRASDVVSDSFNIKYSPSFPPTFLPIYSKVRLMRTKLVTPVDSVGCAMLPVTINEKFGIKKYEMLPKNYRLQLLVSLMLSSQTKDETNAQAMYNLMEYCVDKLNIKQGITLNSLLEIEEKQLDALIYSVGFHKKKSGYIKRMAQMLLDEFEQDVPTTITGLSSLPGVGPKMGYLALQKAWGIIGGIGVDVHVDRLCKMWKWVDPNKCKTPEHTRKALESWLPHELWNEINPVLVGFGQVICPARGKRCDLCLANKVCKSANHKLVKSGSLDECETSKRGDYSKLLEHLKERPPSPSAQILKK
ncbi:endonuclease III domain-containing protein Ecym_2637 [Eremothecium cymbalariae DBVPG|uniref:Endonuclease III homolog n=1 Tax=Eremothecium cymbalariae (strain CBS 270.75 / DBVPG 7215 / KCTC 17166 / NRRL Y-17582) TaxID=931890 RepID=G8JNS4_ERECY|nr:Hypothetical protein Ecym_2637 [Eremothecium cymbalariae DBVPG\